MSDRSLLLAKKETVYGTSAAPTAANAIWAENVSFKPMGSRVRGVVAKPGVGQIAGMIYGQAVQLTFDVPLSASGVAGTAPKWGPLPQACGWSETIVATTSVTYGLNPDPRTADSLTFVWRDGRRSHSITGARGKCGLKLSAGQRPMLSFSFTGLYSPVTTGALPVHADATWTGWNDANPIAQGRTTFSFAGAAQPLRDLSLDASDNVLFNDLPHQENVQLIGDRSFSGKVKITTPLPSVTNLEALWDAGTVSQLAFVHETTAGKIVTINARGQNDEPEYADEKGEDVVSFGLSLVASALTADDEIAIVLT